MSAADFTELVDLASAELGGAVLFANDEFFAPKDNLLKASAPEWREHEYTERGKWMDGWETRRRREPGHDFCVIRLGLPGRVRGLVVDTSHFKGNHPAECSVEACAIDDVLDLDALPGVSWSEILGRRPLKGDSKNAFAIDDARRLTHLRLNIFPDGGVARLRVHGEVAPDWARAARYGGLVDLAAVENGARSLECSDMFFGSRNNLLLPGRPKDMSSGWETRRRRGPGHEWNLVQLGTAGVIRRVEIDTTHFRGNAPARCSIEACDGLEAADWRVLLPETRTQPHTRHLFEAELRSAGRVTHLRLNVFPDGGVARLRAFGEPDIEPLHQAAVVRLNGMARDLAIATLRSFCGSLRWAERMADARPFENGAALYRIADRAFWSMEEQDWLEAFAAHSRIGERAGDRQAREEQRGVLDADRAQLAGLNEQYFHKHGFVFLVCAAGRSGAEMLDELKHRLGQSRAQEIRTAAEEQAKILRLRIARFLEGHPA
ncbi:MAG: allantoicase [Deltaproteobacteria bacterium]|nr:MAG: allantoicase [Deltaproteobacteria bacterium]